MLIWLNQHNALVFLIVACAGVALWKGGRAEKLAALANAAATLAWLAAQSVFPAGPLAMTALALDGLLAFAFLLVALWTPAPWIGVALLLQAAQFALHSYYFVTEREPDNLFAAVSNTVSVGVLVSITTGVILAWRARVRARVAASSAVP